MTTLDADTIEIAVAGKLDALQRLLAETPEIARLRGPGEETLLHIAVRQWPKLANGAEVARALIAAGADVNAADDSGLRPIMGATGDLALTRVLLEAGAETAIYAETHMNMSPAEVCLFYGLPEEARLLVEYGAPVDLRVAAGLGDEARVRGYLDDKGGFRADSIGLPGQPGPKLTLEQGITQALSYAARNGQEAIVTLLLDRGAGIDALVEHFDVGCTPLHQAVSGGHLGMARLLVARGARLDIRDDGHQSTAREWAEHQGKTEIAEFLAANDG